MGIGKVWEIVKGAFNDFWEDDAMSHGAAVAFYTALSFAPLLMLLVTVSSTLGEGTQDKIVEQFESFIGPEAGVAVEQVMENAEDKPRMTSLAGWISFGVLFFSASTVFAQLQAAMNSIWDVKPKPNQGVWAWIRKRLLSMGMIAAIMFLLLSSLVVTSVLQVILGEGEGIWFVAQIAISLAVFTILFAAIFKILPDVQIGWKHVWTGSFITALLFIGGKYLIGLYLSKAAVGSEYGAAGSLVLLLLWVYYSSLILFFGAEITQVYARVTDHAIVPDQHAEWRPDAKHRAIEASKPAEPHTA